MAGLLLPRMVFPDALLLLPPSSASHTPFLHVSLSIRSSSIPYGRRQVKERRGNGASKKTQGRDGRTVFEEEIYSINKGPEIIGTDTEKLLESIGGVLPRQLKGGFVLEKSSENVDKKTSPRQTHKSLRVMAGKAKGRKLLSPSDMNVRPMMEVVRGAVFDALQARLGGLSGFSSKSWLDLYSGTGSVGIEALSRGCSTAHFVEMDPWVVAEVLQPNLEATKFNLHSVLHMTKVETFLEQAIKSVGNLGPFDFVSFTPPYERVDYNVVMGQLSASALISKETYLATIPLRPMLETWRMALMTMLQKVVEYPSKLAILDSCGPIPKILDRRYGRTHVAIYGPS